MSSHRLRYAIDVVIVALLAGAVAIELTGGFYSEPFGVRVSARRPDRPFLAALVIAFVRWRWLPSSIFLGVPLDAYRRLRQRLYERGADAPAAGTSRRWDALALAGLAAIALFQLQTQLRQMTSVPDLGDPLFSVWRMAWVRLQLAGDPRALFDANIFHPTALTLTMSDSMFLPSLAAAPFFAAGVHPIVVYNAFLVAMFPLSGIATYYLIRKLTGSPAASFVGALYYMCHPYRLEHYSHFELQVTMWMPLALVALIRFSETARVWYALAAAACTVAQLYSSMYYGVFFPFYAAAVGIVFMATQGWDWRRLWKAAALAAAAALILAVPLMRPYVAAQAMKGDRPTAAVEFYSADSSDYFRPHPRLALHGGRWLEANHPERALFPGVTPILLSAVALAPPIGPIRLAFTAGLALGYDMTRGLKGTLYPTLYRIFPPLRGMRVPARFSIILGISLAVLAAYGARRLWSRWSGGWRRRLIFAAVVGAMVIDLRPVLELRPVWTDIPRIYQDLAGRKDVVLAEFPFEQTQDRWITNELPFMYFSAWHGHQMVNGYSGFIPDDHFALVELARGFPDAASIAALRSRDVTHVTVNCFLIGGPCNDLLATIDRWPELKLLEIAHWQGRPTRLYELIR